MRARRMAPVTTKATPEEARAAIERRVVQVMEAFGLTRMMDLTDWIAYAGSFGP